MNEQPPLDQLVGAFLLCIGLSILGTEVVDMLRGLMRNWTFAYVAITTGLLLCITGTGLVWKRWRR